MERSCVSVLVSARRSLARRPTELEPELRRRALRLVVPPG
jgi:hypothetical protein